MFGKQQFVGKVEGSVTDKYDLIKVNYFFISKRLIVFILKFIIKSLIWNLSDFQEYI